MGDGPSPARVIWRQSRRAGRRRLEVVQLPAPPRLRLQGVADYDRREAIRPASSAGSPAPQKETPRELSHHCRPRIRPGPQAQQPPRVVSGPSRRMPGRPRALRGHRGRPAPRTIPNRTPGQRQPRRLHLPSQPRPAVYQGQDALQAVHERLPGTRRTQVAAHGLRPPARARPHAAGRRPHELDRAQLACWRAAIERDHLPFKKIAAAAAFRTYFGEVQGERLKTVPGATRGTIPTQISCA